MICKIKGVWHVHNFESNMTANDHSINDSSVLEKFGKVELDTLMNFDTSVHSDTSNNSLRKTEKYISEKYDEATLINLKEKIVAELRKGLSINNYKLSASSQVINVLNNQIDFHSKILSRYIYMCKKQLE